MKPNKSLHILSMLILWVVTARDVRATDFAHGEVMVIPVAEGDAPKIDGDAADWNLVASEPAYITAETAAEMHTEWAFMADEKNFYIYAQTSLPGRPYTNPHEPHERFWKGDLLQLRMTSDPGLRFPLDLERDAESDRVAHISIWKNSETGVEYLHIARGTRPGPGPDVNPPGSEVRLVEMPDRYVVEAKIPWSVLKVPDGKNPFGPDRPGTGVAETLWFPVNDSRRTKLGFAQDGGVFSFNRPHTWGRMKYPDRAPDSRLRPTMEELLADIALNAEDTGAGREDGVPITIEVPEDGLSASVNIFGPKGEVIRELFAGKDLKKGSLKVLWDGLDAFGKPVELGTYRWGAYLHKGLDVEFMGSVGISGNPPYPTQNGLGMWGGDHSNPIGIATDETGQYFLWPVAESGRSVVKVDYNGNTVFRASPFTGGGFDPFYAITSDGENVYLARGRSEIFLTRLDSERGRVIPWADDEGKGVRLFDSELKPVPENATPVGIAAKPQGKKSNQLAPLEKGWTYSPNCFGIAVIGSRIFVSNFSRDAILMFDKGTGAPIGELSCAGPRGLTVHDGNLFVASYSPGQPGRIVRFDKGQGDARVVVSDDLEAPFGVALDTTGNLYVSDLGASQQVKVFSPAGKLLDSIGRQGGRPWQGTYRPDSPDFLMPAGLAVDRNNTLIVAESSPPKVFSRFRLPKLELAGRWYGTPAYWASTFPMPDDPRNVLYMLSYAFGRAKVRGPAEVGVPNAYWQPNRAGFSDTEEITDAHPSPRIVQGANGRFYLPKDSGMRDIYVLEENDTLRPVAQFRFVRKQDEGNDLGRDHLRIWADSNADGLQQDSEITIVEKLANGQPMRGVSNSGKSMAFLPNGDVFLNTTLNTILRVPAKAMKSDGQIVWDSQAIQAAISPIYPGLKEHRISHRLGPLGLARNSKGEFYVAFNARLPGGTGNYDFADEQSAEVGMRGMGHTSSSNAVKFLKFDAAGQLLWMGGRKAQSGARPGEIYHFWNLAGLVGDGYVAGASEWGTVAFYTHDGFYVDTIFNNPASAPPPGPMTFSGETSGANVTYFPQLDEVWAYSTARAFRVKGFKEGKVVGERRMDGEVKLDQIRRSEDTNRVLEPLVVQKLDDDLFASAADWSAVPASQLLREGNQLAEARFGLNDRWLFGRIEVSDPTPMENTSDQIELAFKWGDSVALVLGPAEERTAAGAGDIRILATEIEGKPKLVGMKAVTTKEKQPFEYTTPSSGTVAFEFVGEIPGGKVRIERSANGYVAFFAVPLDFLELDLSGASALRGDIEVRLSGHGQRGLQAMSRNYLFTPSTTATTMVDDIPVESKLYPEFWGVIEVR